MTLLRFKPHFLTPPGWFLLPCAVIVSLAGSGCHQRAYNELYVENMASEIRLLEDRIYEYDAEYRALESELEDLRVINEGLESRLREAETERSDRFSQPKSTPKTDATKPVTPKSASPKPAAPKPAAPKPAAPKSSNAESPTAEPVTPDVEPKPSAPSQKTKLPKESLKLPPDDIQLEVETPEPPPLKKPSVSESGEALPPKSESPAKESLLPGSPSLDLPSSPSPAPLPQNPKPVLPPERASRAPRGLPSTVARASYEELRISAPTLPTAQDSPIPGSSTPRDLRAREIEFHPGLCRGIRRDGNATEEGVVLVLVPRNKKREFVPATGKITVVLEEATEGEAHRLGKWEYSPEEIAELIEPVGSGQGIHLELPWQENKPLTNLLDVYVRFTDDQGITMVNHRQIHLRKPTPGQSTWTPK